MVTVYKCAIQPSILHSANASEVHMSIADVYKAMSQTKPLG